MSEFYSPDWLYNISSEVSKEEAKTHRYIYNSYRFDWGYRTITLNNLIKNKSLSKDKLPQYVLKFINTKGKVIVIPCTLSNKVVGVLLRDIPTKDFVSYLDKASVFYGLGKVSKDFKYGDRIVLVEGAVDRDSLSSITNNCLAILHASLSYFQIRILQCLTNNVSLLYDNDVRGIDGAKRDIGRLSKYGINAKILKHPAGIKDSGTLAEYLFYRKDYEYNQLFSYYKSILI